MVIVAPETMRQLAGGGFRSQIAQNRKPLPIWIVRRIDFGSPSLGECCKSLLQLCLLPRGVRRDDTQRDGVRLHFEGAACRIVASAHVAQAAADHFYLVCSLLVESQPLIEV